MRRYCFITFQLLLSLVKSRKKCCENSHQHAEESALKLAVMTKYSKEKVEKYNDKSMLLRTRRRLKFEETTMIHCGQSNYWQSALSSGLFFSFSFKL
jgi:uracil DNA glycosylase